MSKMFSPLDLDLDSLRKPGEINFLRFLKDGVVLTTVYLSGGTVVFPPVPAPARVVASGTPLVGGFADIALVGNWGSPNPTIAVGANSNDNRGDVIIVPDAGVTGTRSWVLTFKDGAWANAPYCLALRKIGTAAFSQVTDVVTTTTTLTVTVGGVGSAGVNDLYRFILLG